MCFVSCLFVVVVREQCLTVQLYEHQRQDTQWMYDQEMLEGGSMRHVWAELPPHPYAPEVKSSLYSCISDITPRRLERIPLEVYPAELPIYPHPFR